jgi:hypothetical protein
MFGSGLGGGGAVKAPTSILSCIDPKAVHFYRDVLTTLNDAQIPFLVGGAFAFERYTGIVRYTKDLDLFVLGRDVSEILSTFATCGYRTELTNSAWIGKVFCDKNFTDFIFSSANGIAEVDEEWFEHSADEIVLGIPVKTAPIEEIIWSKAFIMERERYDGADIAHLLYMHGRSLDWPRLMRRFGSHWRVLLSSLVLFGFIYPSERDCVPDWVMQKLLQRLQNERADPQSAGPVCRGTLLSDKQYLVDIEDWGQQDARADAVFAALMEEKAA